VKEVSSISARTVVTLEQDTFFFLSEPFIFRNNPENIVTFKHEEGGVEVVKIFFSQSANSIKSLDHSPFGGFILSQGASEDSIAKLIVKIEAWCSRIGVMEICIRIHPDIYNPIESRLVDSVLHQTGYQVALKELLQVIAVDRNSLAGFKRDRRRKLRSCIEAGFRFVRLSPDQIDSAYSIFVECRNDKNYPVTMSLDDFKIAFKKFPDQYFLFGVLDGDTLVAASVCVVVNDQILYDFFQGDRLSMRKFSPLTLLVKGIIEFCLDHGFRLLDLGVSTDERGINIGLQQFKTSFGARTDQKLTYYKRILPS
jgi:hypothetical protein